MTVIEKPPQTGKAMPQVAHITLAFHPTEKQLASIRDWFTEEIHQPVQLDITIDTNLIAGAIIEYNGKHKDYTIAKKLGIAE
ncbi:MAG TPA: F0F1 ATP synthase subunit delta [Patescibacteria group bacterium]|nr:F0F1 ATP synthase subunit delta [Patescibacteria group bacterium]